MTGPDLKLDDFDQDGVAASPLITRTGEAWESARAAAFAEGFEAGREMERHEQQAAAETARCDIAEALQALDFTHAAARRQVIESLRPLVTALAHVLVPRMAETGLADHLARELQTLAERTAGARVTLRVAPGQRDALAAQTAGTVADPEIVEDPSLGPNEVLLGAGALERHIDIDGALAEIAGRIADFDTLTEEMQTHG